jgi:diguanylate cyclase (GGDEF)-like protein
MAMAVSRLFRGKPEAQADEPADYGSVAIIRPGDNSRRLEVLDDFEHAGIGWLWATDEKLRLIYISENAAVKLDTPVDEMLALPLTRLFEAAAENTGDRSARPLNFQLNARNKIIDQIVRFVPGETQRMGRPAWWSISGHPKFDKSGKFQGYRGSAKDITAEYERQLVDSRLAEFDSLTGLANRHRMDKKLESILAAYKAAKRSCTLVMLDLDRFKHVNDTLGHQAGDDLLCQVARRLERVAGGQGEIGRLGGDEFQIILPDLDDRGKLGELAGKIIQILSQPYVIDDKRAVIGTSIGIAISPYDGIEKLDLVHNADLALYAAKNGGRGQFRFYSADLKDEAEERSVLEEGLRDALAAGELELHYQPVVRTEDNMVVTFEALMRWDHPERGPISPAVFVPIAEESDLINQLGAWALHRACMDAMVWPKSVRVAVNVSAAQFAHPGLIDVVTHAIESSGIEPGRLELELTESVFMGDGDTVDDIFRALKNLGVRLALDDFGTGYSSLSYLRSAPFDKIKVDRTFVDDCTQTDHNSAKIIAAIIGLSDALGMETTVEGVEAFDQLEVVKSKGARFIQGWIYAKAMTQENVIRRMASGELRIEPDGPDRHRPERRSVFRRIAIIHDDHRYEALMRNLSKTGALIDGLLGVTEGTGLVLDLGGGQLAVCIVTRVQDAMIAVEFETPLVSDGAGGLCTRHRVSPYILASVGMVQDDSPKTKPQFIQVAAVSTHNVLEFGNR